jgi:membrane carboxypeptidase/penicillin-binding protein
MTSLFRHVDTIVSRVLAFCATHCLADQLKALLITIRALQTSADRPKETQDAMFLVRALVVGEDRRFYLHGGIDTRSLLRALATYLHTGEVQGASTITQQLVRVLTNDYRRAVRRKIREMCLASAVDREVAKEDQALLYLGIGYFGWHMNGLRQARQRLRLTSALSAGTAAAIVARLRYPEPQSPTILQTQRIDRRKKYIEAQMR